MHKIEIRQIAIESWNACRLDIYHLAEDMGDGYAVEPVLNEHLTDPEHLEAARHFNRGFAFAAKSFARAFNSFEAIDADKMAEIFKKIEDHDNV